MNTTQEEYDNMLKMQAGIKRGLAALNGKENWYFLYEEWKKNERNQFFSILRVVDSFNLSCAGDNYIYNSSDESHMVNLDIMSMSVFLSEHLSQLCKDTFSIVRKERNRNSKIRIIECYFEIIDEIVRSSDLSGCIGILNEAAEKQMVLMGLRPVDLYVVFYSLRELLRKETTESLYLLYTYWRITQSRKNLKVLLDAIVD